jgi:flagellar biosynthesis GTPase FlhF
MSLIPLLAFFHHIHTNSEPLPSLWEALANTSNKRTVRSLEGRIVGAAAEPPRKKRQLDEQQQQQEQQERQAQQRQKVREEDGNDASSREAEEDKHRRLMRATLEAALYDRFRADCDEEAASQATYEKAFMVLQHVEIEPGGVVAARVARFVEDMLGLQGGRVLLRVDEGSEGRMVDWFLEDVEDGKYDED